MHSTVPTSAMLTLIDEYIATAKSEAQRMNAARDHIGSAKKTALAAALFMLRSDVEQLAAPEPRRTDGFGRTVKPNGKLDG